MKSCRWKLLLSAAALVGAVGLAAPPAEAADLDALLELDGNIEQDTDTDWEDLFDVAGGVATPKSDAALGLLDFSAVQFVRDFAPGAKGPDDSTFATGSKDIQNPSGGNIHVSGQWECNRDNNVGDKTDLVNVYAAVGTANGYTILYFALERFSNEGEANVGFWFNADGTIDCSVTGGGAFPFTGNHTDGDLNIFAEFESGGDNVNVVARQWVGDGATGQLDPTPVASGGDCDDPSPGGVEGNTPSNDLDTGEFFEGAINLTAAGITECFSSFLGDSRSSNSLTADLKDYAGGALPLCSVDASKVCTPDPDPSVCAFDSFSSCTVDADCDQVGVCSDNGAACTSDDKNNCETGSATCDSLANDTCVVEGFCAVTPFSDCTLGNEDSVCSNGPGDRCITENPFIDSDGATIVMQNDVAITNDGGGTIYDVEIKENATLNSGESCAIVAVNGVSVTASDLTGGGFVRVPDNGSDYDENLTMNETVTVAVECETQQNPYPNQVDVRAASSDGGTFNVSKTGVNLGGSDPCTVSPNPMLGLSKQCVDVRLMADSTSGLLVVEVLTKITVENTGNVVLNDVLVEDTIDGNKTTIDSGFSLLPGETRTYNLVDMPAEPSVSATPYCAITGEACIVDGDCPTIVGEDNDCNNSDKYNPDTALFNDTANASADPGIGEDPDPVNATPASVTDCFLCPQPTTP
jgi:hypothetical protein